MKTRTVEECIVKNIEGGIRGIKMGTKTPQDVNLLTSFDRLAKINESLCDDLMNKYENVLKDYKRKIENPIHIGLEG
jgi:hypothetical protein